MSSIESKKNLIPGMTSSDKKFSIYNPAVTYEHREFYETIVERLNGVFPICSQGKSMAVETSENVTEQQQVTDLMKQVEHFSSNLIGVTKELFNQFYQAKEELYTGIIATTAFNKINLVDRNLLERTCDVRWWALETAFSDCISFVKEISELADKLEHCLEELLPVVDEAQQIRIERLKAALAENIANWVEPTGFEAFAEGLRENIQALSDCEVASKVIQGLHRLQEALLPLQAKIEFACDRLEDINNSYTLYRDLIIVDPQGFVIANSNEATRSRVLGLNVAQEIWFQKALHTENGNEYYAHDVSYSEVEGMDSLIYATAIRENSDENGKAIGVMAVFFDFQGEASLILDEYMPKDENGDILEGFYSLFTNEKGEIIASSDNIILEVGSFAHIPRSHRNLSKGQKQCSYAVFEGTESAIVSAKTDGYLDYQGLGWSSHIIIPKTDVFKNRAKSMAKMEINRKILTHSRLIPEINRETFAKVQDDKESIQLISLNGIVFASKLGRRGAALDPIFKQITKTGEFTTKKIEELLTEMAEGVLDLFSKALENFTKQAIDLIDRNLFERSADIRWWATDKYFWNVLQDPSEENIAKAANRLRVINSSYTMYRNLVLVDHNGDFIACSRNELKNELKQKNYSDRSWFQEGMRMTTSGNYFVEDVADSDLERKKERSLIYAGGVRANGARKGEVIGVLAILFDWDKEASMILKSCLPIGRKGNQIKGIVAFYTNAKGEIIETTDTKFFTVGKKIEFPEKYQNLKPGESVSGFVTFNDTQYLMGTSKTKGYREYEGLSWNAHILRPVY